MRHIVLGATAFLFSLNPPLQFALRWILAIVFIALVYAWRLRAHCNGCPPYASMPAVDRSYCRGTLVHDGGDSIVRSSISNAGTKDRYASLPHLYSSPATRPTLITPLSFFYCCRHSVFLPLGVHPQPFAPFFLPPQEQRI
ncbi:hypothetical protein C8F04DRAFT_1079046 [Mycena alexandri]|uniref:Uncharacterized protein n=1 Tax=Mycena alexandri TaxID=1745969 RepID=A0AAD6TCM7_9AGAR|nr:hypothetical protein C8F04DRAFT_1079046 [Mycena alexandri]